jgi:hypothetical protein
MDTIETELIRDLREALGPEAVRSSSDDIVRMMKDESWLSPVLQRELDRRKNAEGAVRGVQAVVRPTSDADVRHLAAIAVRHRIALTPRGAGTSNFGLLAPEEGGLIVDMRGLTGEPEVTDGAVRAPAGTFQGTMELAARAKGQELPVLTTTYSEATIGGWLCGGHAGLGSGVHGAVWDGIVAAVRVVTLEAEPRVLTFEGEAALPLLHTFGAVGLIVEATMRTGAMNEWVEAVGFFPTFAAASSFVTELSRDRHFRHRAATAQEEGLMPGLRALQSIRQPGAGVLLILDRAQLGEFHRLAAAHGGSLVEWQIWNQAARGGKPSVAQMVFGHRMLWVKRLFPDAAFCHLYFDPDDPDATVTMLKERFGDELLCEMKFFRSPWMMRALGFKPDGLLPAALCVVPNGGVPGKVDEVLGFCDKAGIKYQNSHTNVIEDNGLFPDVAPIVKLKSQLDPHNLLSRGRLRSAEARP